MQRQLELWPLDRSPSFGERIWEVLTPEQRAKATHALARLILKTLGTHPHDTVQEDGHEQQ